MDKTASSRTGFTLIELLIVIALLGALAIGLLATIDPFEQLKKGRDTSIRNTTAELYNANLRYYATKGHFPWNTNTTEIELSAVQADDLTAVGSAIPLLVTAGELKERFVDLAGLSNLSRITITSSAGDHLAVCFEPESKSFQADPVTMFDSAGGSGSNCKSFPNGTADCYLCLQ